MDLNLNEKIALVTGGTRGIGKRIAFRLADEGCAVGICARGRDEINIALSEIRAKKVDAFGIQADVSQAGGPEKFVDSAAEALGGGVDILVNNVGGASGGNLENATGADWQHTFDLNVFHAVKTIRAALPHMRARGGGSVLIVSSITRWKPSPLGSQYGAAKAAGVYLAGSLALEFAEDNIRVNTICPGSILFPGGGWQQRQETDTEAFNAFVKREFPLGRLGRPEEVADVIVFLASERAAWINGASIPVDGAQGRPALF